MNLRIGARLSAARAGLVADLRKLPLGRAFTGLLFGQGNYYAGAENSRKFMDWVFAQTSADKEIQGNLRQLRARARDLARNDAYTKRILKLLKANVVGHKGIQLQAQVRFAAGHLDNKTNKKIEAAFKLWAEDPAEVSADGRLDWLHVQQQVIGETPRDGEVFLRMLPGFKSKFGFALEFIDPDRLDESNNLPARPGVNEIRMGVERNQWGRPVAYHILTAHPADSANDRRTERVPAEQIIHIYAMDRSSQTRGVTWLAPIMRDLKIMDGYFEAELIAARMGAAKMGFFESDADTWAGEGNPPVQQTMDANPGVIEKLAPGIKFSPWLNDHPSTAFPNFVKAVLRRIASGVNSAYNLIANDLEGVSYSSIRQGELNGRDEWRMNQAWVSAVLHRRVYREWLRMAILTGNLKLASYDPSDYYEVTWRPRGWSWVDPLKDQQANILGIQAGLTSPQAVTGEEGEDYEKIQEELSEAREIRAAYAPAQEPGGKLETTGGAIGDGEDPLPMQLKPTLADPGVVEPGAGAGAGAGTTVQDTALNGAQVTALLAIVNEVVAGNLPKATAEAMILAAFPAISPAQVTAMLAGLEILKPAADLVQPAAAAPPPPPNPDPAAPPPAAPIS